MYNYCCQTPRRRVAKAKNQISVGGALYRVVQKEPNKCDL